MRQIWTLCCPTLVDGYATKSATAGGAPARSLVGGPLGEAIPLNEQNVAHSERVLGPDHVDTLISRHSLAAAYEPAGPTPANMNSPGVNAVASYSLNNRDNLLATERMPIATEPDTGRAPVSLFVRASSLVRNPAEGENRCHDDELRASI